MPTPLKNELNSKRDKIFTRPSRLVFKRSGHARCMPCTDFSGTHLSSSVNTHIPDGYNTCRKIAGNAHVSLKVELKSKKLNGGCGLRIKSAVVTLTFFFFSYHFFVVVVLNKNKASVFTRVKLRSDACIYRQRVQLRNVEIHFPSPGWVLGNSLPRFL